MYALGIDGGGSRTRALLCDTYGQIIDQGLSGGTNPRTSSTAELKTHLKEAIKQATQSIDCSKIIAAQFGLAGAGEADTRSKVKTIAMELLSDQTACTIGHDLEIALVGGLANKTGIVLVAGTGSACYGRSCDGRSAKCGGWGDLVDDVGSGSWIGLRALQAGVRQADGRLPESPLKKAVMGFLKIDHMNTFKARIHDAGLSRSERARLAPIILNLASEGDAASIAIVAEGVDALSNCVFSTSRQLDMEAPSVLLSGGLLKHTYFSHSLEAALYTRIPSAIITKPILCPAAGAVLIALKAVNSEISDANIDKLREASYS
ncbi:MAG: BadF/BadG/BcrA/BcrD ATPase family protein [Verrucomicrobiota bacterium]|nr:BadF/BadG/BcrA/BcrD ATPase family protein [Verrucomicrobiota bacterium]